LKADSDLPWLDPVVVRLRTGTGQRPDKETIEFTGPGTLSMPVTFEGEPVTAGATQFAWTLIARAEPPVGIIIDAPEVKLAGMATVPAPVDTDITGQIVSITEARWTDLMLAVATFDADVSFQVNGPLPSGTKIVLVCPPAVKSIHVTPSVLHSGSQTVRFTIQAQVAASPTANHFDIQIKAPSPSGAVRFPPPSPLRFDITGPAALQILLVNPDGASPSVRVRDRSEKVLLAGVPVLSGQTNAPTGGLSARLRTGPLFGMHDPGPVPTYQALALPLILPEDTSFFFDTVLEEDIEIISATPSAALVGSRQRCVITVDAPFKRWCFYLAIVIAVLVTAGILIRVCTRPDTDADPAQPATPLGPDPPMVL
jgi:hypothetical protein